jgi:hypothetical protein
MADDSKKLNEGGKDAQGISVAYSRSVHAKQEPLIVEPNF